MYKLIVFLFLSIYVQIVCISQDSIINTNINLVEKVDSSKKITDSILPKEDSTLYSLIKQYPLIKTNATTNYIISDYKKFGNKDIVFYTLLVCFFLLAFTKTVYPKYFASIFAIFFQTNFRQKQTKDQLLQDIIPAVLNNCIFFLSIACVATILIPKLVVTEGLQNWQIFILSLVIIITIYSIKYIFLLFMGWIFNIKEASNAYLFIVFIINKIIGIIILPICVIMAFAKNNIVDVIEVIGLTIVSLLLLYRVFLCYRSTNTRLKINILHFFLYFCSLEILPLLIIFKVLQQNL